MLRDTPQRQPMPSRLGPRLRLLWTAPSPNWQAGSPVVDTARSRVFARHRQGEQMGLASLDIDTGVAAWFALARQDASAVPLAVWNDTVLATGLDRVCWLDAETGGVRDEVLGVRGNTGAVVDDVLLVQGYGALTAVDLPRARVLWTLENVAREAACCSAAGIVFVGLEDGALLGLSLRDGSEVWRVGPPEKVVYPGLCVFWPTLKGVPTVLSDLVVAMIGGTWGKVRGYSVSDGSLRFESAVEVRDLYVVGDCVHALTSTLATHSYARLDARTGQVVRRFDFEIPASLRRRHVTETVRLAASETGIFVGTPQGAVLACGVAGDPIWHARIGSSLDHLGGLVLLPDRLLCSDGLELYCFVAQDHQASQQDDAGHRPREGCLAFTIEGTIREKECVVLRCLTRGRRPARFQVEVSVGERLGLCVSSVADGEALLAAFRYAFPARRHRARKGTAVAGFVQVPTLAPMESSVDPDWQVLRLALPFTDNEDAEATFAFTESRLEGYFEELEDSVRQPLCDFVARLLVRP